jgi:hypothetical protein
MLLIAANDAKSAKEEEHESDSYFLGVLGVLGG